MKDVFRFIFVIAFALGVSLLVNAATEELAGNVAVNFNRACRYAADNLQYATNPASATASTGLQAGTKYRLFCTTATYFDQEASGGVGTATSADAQVAANTSVDIWTKRGDFVSLKAVATTGACDLLECQ